jgi:hypothetical protein
LRGHSGEGNAGEGGESKEEGRTPRRNVRALWREGREQLTQGEEEPVRALIWIEEKEKRDAAMQVKMMHMTCGLLMSVRKRSEGLATSQESLFGNFPNAKFDREC